MRRIALIVVLLLFVEVGAQPAAAHPANRFRACTKQPAGQCMNVGAEIFWGATAILKGKVRPRHAGFMADVLRRNPRGHVWREVAEARVSDAGTMRYRWLTSLDDVHDLPYRFKFRIRGHGRSNATEAYVVHHPTPSPPPE